MKIFKVSQSFSGGTSVGCGETGSRVALIDNRPKICYENRMVPICGRSFWANNNGARIFCNMLGKADGIVEKAYRILVQDAYVVGKCSEYDTKLTGCTDQCNKNTLGGTCNKTWGSKENGELKTCNKGSNGGAKVICFGKTLIFV